MSFINNNGIKISYTIIDECNGDYLLLHTGLNSTKEAWIELSYTVELKKHWKLILIDPRGHGESMGRYSHLDFWNCSYGWNHFPRSYYEFDLNSKFFSMKHT